MELIYGALAADPRRAGRSLRLDLTGVHSARRGEYRVLYRIDDEARRVYVMTIEHRADVCRERSR